MRPRAIEVDIGTLVLHGEASPADAPRVGIVVQRELSRLITEQVPRGLSRAADIESLESDAVSATLSGGPQALGEHIARALHGELNR